MPRPEYDDTDFRALNSKEREWIEDMLDGEPISVDTSSIAVAYTFQDRHTICLLDYSEDGWHLPGTSTTPGATMYTYHPNDPYSREQGTKIAFRRAVKNLIASTLKETRSWSDYEVTK